MGSQGNYPGSGAVTKHHTRALGGEIPGGSVMDNHLQEGGDRSSGIVCDPAMPKGKGSPGEVRIVNP